MDKFIPLSRHVATRNHKAKVPINRFISAKSLEMKQHVFHMQCPLMYWELHECAGPPETVITNQRQRSEVSGRGMLQRIHMIGQGTVYQDNLGTEKSSHVGSTPVCLQTAVKSFRPMEITFWIYKPGMVCGSPPGVMMADTLSFNAKIGLVDFWV